MDRSSGSDALSARTRRLDAILLALLVSCAFALGFIREFSGDFHWHVVLGDWTRAHAAVYRHDTLSHTYLGAPMVVSAWLADVSLSFAFRAGGYPLCYALRGVAIALTAALLYREMRLVGAGALAVVAVLALALADTTHHFYLRPETFAFPLWAATLHLLGTLERRALAGVPARASWKPFAALLAVVVVWANMHGSVSLALLAAGVYAAERAVRSVLGRNVRAAVSALAVPVGVAAAASLSPEGPATLFGHRILTEGCNMQLEWLPMTPAYMTAAQVFGLAAVVVTTALAGRRASPWRVLLFAAMVVLAASHRRFATVTWIAGAPLLASNLTPAAERIARHLRTDLRELAGGVLSVLALAAAGWEAIAEQRVHTTIGLDAEAGVYPEQACRFVRSSKPPGKMLNSFNIGGYLTFCLEGAALVAIDQRACSVFPGAFYQRYLEASKNTSELRRFADEIDASWSIVTYESLWRRMAEDPWRWRLIYFDDVALVYARADRPETAPLAEASALTHLEPARLLELALTPVAELGQPRRALDEQRRRCGQCLRTRLADAAVSMAQGDGVRLGEVLAAISAEDRRLLPAETAFLAYGHSVMRGDASSAQRELAAFMAAGGSPQLTERLIDRQRERKP